MTTEPIFFAMEDGQLDVATLIGIINDFVEEINPEGEEGGEFNSHITALKSLSRYLGKNLYVKLITSFDGSDYPVTFNQDVLLRKATQDFLMIRRSYLEASSDSLKANQTAQDVRTLIRAMALSAFTPAIAPFFADVFHEVAPKAITYQAHRFEIRIVPYSSVLFIGYPATLQVTDDFPDFADGESKLDAKYIAIAHEVGHKVFNHGYFKINDRDVPIESYLRARIKNSLAKAGTSVDLIEWADSKIEELFADAYGGFVDGPVSVLGFQAQMHRSRPAGITERNHRYLYTPLRPLVQAKVLRALKQPNEAWMVTALDLLDEIWRDWVLNNWRYWLRVQWPELAVGNSIHPLSNVDLIEGASYPMGSQKMIGHALLKVLDSVLQEFVDLFDMMNSSRRAVDVSGADQETLGALLHNRFSQQAGEHFRGGLGAVETGDGSRKPPPSSQVKQILQEILLSKGLNLNDLFVGPDAPTAIEFVESIVGNAQVSGAAKQKFADALEAGNRQSNDLKDFVELLTNRHDRGELDVNEVNLLLHLIKSEGAITPEQIDEIVERQLLRGWSDEGPMGGGGFGAGGG